MHFTGVKRIGGGTVTQFNLVTEICITKGLLRTFEQTGENGMRNKELETLEGKRIVEENLRVKGGRSNKFPSEIGNMQNRITLIITIII